MAIEYAIELPCEPKRRFGYDGLSDRLRRAARLRLGPRSGVEALAEAREADFQLRPVAFHCARCPANASGSEFGCFGSLETPLELEAEAWLMSLLPDSLDLRRVRDPAVLARIEQTRLLVHRAADAAAAIRAVDRLREPATLLAAPAPVIRSWGRPWRRRSLSSSYLLHLFFFQGRLGPGAAEPVCRALGVWADGGRDREGLPEAVFTQPAEETDPPPVAALKRYLHVLMVAASLDAALRVNVRADFNYRSLHLARHP